MIDFDMPAGPGGAARARRLYDGPTEVHKYAIARQVLRAV
jgi:hypothetical protein